MQDTPATTLMQFHQPVVHRDISYGTGDQAVWLHADYKKAYVQTCADFCVTCCRCYSWAHPCSTILPFSSAQTEVSLSPRAGPGLLGQPPQCLRAHTARYASACSKKMLPVPRRTEQTPVNVKQRSPLVVVCPLLVCCSCAGPASILPSNHPGPLACNSFLKRAPR